MTVSFADEAKPEPRSPSSAAAGGPAQTARFERELAATRAKLRCPVRKFEIANEKQKVAIEETMSANEEPKTSKKELQSLNEVLMTLNGQFRDAIDHQRRTATDLQNIPSRSDPATLFLDDPVNIRFLTPGAEAPFGATAKLQGRRDASGGAPTSVRL
ncbi:MAG: hypothetical protein GC191_16380 [Azospirillum sp.]|nr:hypothetical protein [Azospirillum sp.]